MNSEQKPAVVYLQALFSPETKFGEQKFRYNLKTWPIDSIHVDRIVTASADPEQRVFVGKLVVHLYNGASPKPHNVSIMRTRCIFAGLPMPMPLSDTSSPTAPKRFDLAVPTDGLPFDLSQGVFEPRSTCIADAKSLAAAHAECNGNGETWLCVNVRPTESLVDSLMVFLRLELQPSQ